jgi:hypothetical protein
LLERFSSHKSFSEASVAQVLAPYQSRAQKVAVSTLASTVFLNRGERFEATALPRDAQLAPAFGISVADFNGDGHEDIFLAQNFFATEPEIPPLDAGRGLVLLGDGRANFKPLPSQESGIEVYGEQRGCAVSDFDADGRPDLVVAQNGATTRLFRNAAAPPGIRVRLQGPKHNPTGVGGVLRTKAGGVFGPAREIHAGSGYWSQDGAVTVFGKGATEIQVRWPGGALSTTPVLSDASEIIVKSVTK